MKGFEYVCEEDMLLVNGGNVIAGFCAIYGMVGGLVVGGYIGMAVPGCGLAGAVCGAIIGCAAGAAVGNKIEEALNI